MINDWHRLQALTILAVMLTQSSAGAAPAASKAGTAEAKSPSAAAAGADYYASCVKDGVHRWGQDHMPLRVEIMAENAKVHPTLATIVRESLAAWQKASDNKVSFAIADHAAGANFADSDIVIDFVDRNYYDEKHSLWGRAQQWTKGDGKDAPLEKSVVELFTNPPRPGQKVDDADIKRSAMYEVGRALGLCSSPAKTDVMSLPTAGGLGAGALSARDLSTIKKLYAGYQPVTSPRAPSAKAALEQAGTNLPSSYLNDVSRKITKSLKVAGEEEDEVTCSFVIAADGTISDVKCEEGGAKALEGAVTKAVTAASPLKPLPAKPGTEAASARLSIKVNGEGMVEVLTKDKTASEQKEEAKAAMQAWVTKITDLVKSNWKSPSQAQFVVSAKIRVLPDGKIYDVRIVKSSGSSAVDMSVVRAAYEVAPLPPYPPETGLSFAEVEIELEMKKQG